MSQKIECICGTKKFIVNSNKPYYYDIPENIHRKKIKIFIVTFAGYNPDMGIGVYLSFGHRPYSSYISSDVNPQEDAYYCQWLRSFAQTSIFEDEETPVSKCVKSSIHVMIKPRNWVPGFSAEVWISHYEKN